MKKEEKNSKRTKSIDILPADIFNSKYQQSSIHQSQTGKKNQDQGGFQQRSGQKDVCNHGFPTIGANVNAIKKEIKDFSQVECYNYY